MPAAAKLATPPEWVKLHRISAGSLLLAERQALGDLRAATRAAVGALLLAIESARRGGREALKLAILSALRRLAPDLRTAATAAILASRTRVRGVALQRLDKELALIERTANTNAKLARPGMSDAAEDPSHADAAGASLASAWTAGVVATTLAWADSDDASTSPTFAGTVDAVDNRARRIAVTEMARAYNDEHDEGVGWIAETYADETWLVGVLRRWDATLDARTCTRCAGMDGTVLPIGMSFGVEPGYVHPWCRCIDTLIFVPARVRDTVPAGYVGDDIEAA